MRSSLATIVATTALTFAFTGCTAAENTPDTSAQVTTLAPTAEAATTSTTSQVAAEIAGVRPQLQKSIDSYRDGRCARLLEGGEKGIEAATCVAASITIDKYGQVLVMELDMLEPWSPEIESLAAETRSRAKSMSATAASNSDNAPRMLDTEALFMTSILDKWDAYLR